MKGAKDIDRPPLFLSFLTRVGCLHFFRPTPALPCDNDTPGDEHQAADEQGHADEQRETNPKVAAAPTSTIVNAMAATIGL